MGRGSKEVIMWQKSYLPPQHASGKEEARKYENPTSTHNDPSKHHGELTDEEFPSNVSCQLDICQIPLASNHSQTVVWTESALSFSGTKLELGCKYYHGAGERGCKLCA